MRYRILFLLLVLVVLPSTVHASEDRVFFSMEYGEPADVLDYFPLQVGNMWVYEYTQKNAIETEAELPETEDCKDKPYDPFEHCGPTLTKQWTEEVVVTGHYDVPEGKVIVREVQEKDVRFEYPAEIDASEIGDLDRGEKTRIEPYLIRGNYVYEIPEWGWDPELGELTPKLRERLEGLVPDFFFPMSKVQLWAERKREEDDFRRSELFKQGKGPAPNPGMYYWAVQESGPVQVPYGKIEGSYFLMYRTVGGPSMVWFKDGLGVVKTEYVHSGSYWNTFSELRAFYPGGK
jgi:hypothetical protein